MSKASLTGDQITTLLFGLIGSLAEWNDEKAMCYAIDRLADERQGLKQSIEFVKKRIVGSEEMQSLKKDWEASVGSRQ